MLQFTPLRILKLRNHAKPHAYLRSIGFTHSTAHLLIKGQLKEVKIEYIVVLCHNCNCSIADLFTYTPEPGAPPLEQDTLAPLIRSGQPATDLNAFFQRMPIDRIESLNKELADRLNSITNERHPGLDPGSHPDPAPSQPPVS